MTNTTKSLEDFFEQLTFDVDLYDVYYEDELLQSAKYFLDEYNVQIHKGCDYRNDQNEDGYYYCDMASERADSMVDIYYSELWKKAQDFQYFTEEALTDFGFDKKRGMAGLLQMGQYLYYSRLAGYVLHQLEEYINH